jgi:hypothetical protein
MRPRAATSAGEPPSFANVRRLAILVAVAAGSGSSCSHDWSLADGPGERGGAEADGAGETGETAEDARDAAETDEGGATWTRCGNGTVELPEQCDGNPDEPCIAGGCTGWRTCLAGCMWSACEFGVAPPGDACDAETPTISDLDPARTFRGSTCGARDDAAPAPCLRGAAGPDVFYALSLSRDQRVTLTVTATDFDVVLFLSDAFSCGTDALSCEDEVSPDDPVRRTLTLDLAAGAYWVGIDGVGPDDEGSFLLEVVFEDLHPPPSNDDCIHAERIVLPDGMGSGRVSGSTASATSDTTDCDAATGPDVWYSLSLPEPAIVYLDTFDGGDWSSVLEVVAPSCDASGGEPAACGPPGACGTNRSQVALRLPAGEFAIVVDGASEADRGDFVLDYLVVPGLCGNATSIAGSTVVTGDTDGRPDRFVPSCVPGHAGVGDDMYFLPLCAGDRFRASTCHPATNYDTVLELRSGSCTDGSPVMQCNDDTDLVCRVIPENVTSDLDVDVRESGLYFLLVDGFQKMGRWDSSGSYGLTLERVIP